MVIGVLKEVKANEFRVAAVPATVTEMVRHGHTVYVETGAGIGSGFSDKDYEAAGAVIADTNTVWEKADLYYKVKELFPQEYKWMNKDKILFTYTLLGEGTFLYDVTQEKLYVTISEDGVTCSTSDAADAPADVPPVLTLPILDEIDRNVTIGTSGSSLLAVQEAVKLLDWGENTGLGADEISDAASTWLAARNNDLTDCLKKLELVDEAYRKLLTDEARELLDSAGCEDVEITWGSDPVEPVEAIMQAAGLRG